MTTSKGDRVRYLVMRHDGKGMGLAHIARTPAFGVVTRVRQKDAQRGDVATIRVEDPSPGSARYVERYVTDIEPAGPRGAGPRFAVAFDSRRNLHTLCAVPQPDGSVVLTVTPETDRARKQVLTVPAAEWAKLAACEPTGGRS